MTVSSSGLPLDYQDYNDDDAWLREEQRRRIAAGLAPNPDDPQEAHDTRDTPPTTPASPSTSTTFDGLRARLGRRVYWLWLLATWRPAHDLAHEGQVRS